MIALRLSVTRVDVPQHPTGTFRSGSPATVAMFSTRCRASKGGTILPPGPGPSPQVQCFPHFVLSIFLFSLIITVNLSLNLSAGTLKILFTLSMRLFSLVVTVSLSPTQVNINNNNISTGTG